MLSTIVAKGNVEPQNSVNYTNHHCYVGDEHHYAKQECNFYDTSCFIINCTGGMSRGCSSFGCVWAWGRATLCGGDYACCDEDFCNGPPNLLW
ncbi:hypothetical protein AAVH_36334 [Aphelenchoides avenae]|nr:hypothetical protein AAVH_36334 [Aphelenchus avenae]